MLLFFCQWPVARHLRCVVGYRRLSPVETVTPSGRADYGHRNVDFPSKPGHGHLGFPAQAFPPWGTCPAYFEKTAVSFGGVNLSWFHLFIFGLTIVMMVGLNLIIKKTRWGKAMRAVAQNKTMAALTGINVNRVISYTFALAGALGGAAGIMVAAFYNSLYPTMGYVAGVKAFAAAVLGGIGSVPGAMLGGVVLGVAEAFGAGYLSSLYRDGISYAVMIIVIIFIPAGLFGRVLKETKKSM